MEQKSFYFQIKGKLGEPQAGFYGGNSNWSFPPIFSGKVEAADKKEAKIKIDAEYEKKFPLRVLSKDLDSNEFLLNIDELKEGSHYNKLFELQKCEQCESTFYVIDKYNDHNCDNKSFSFCSNKCREENKMVAAYIRNENEVLAGSAMPVVYKITNKVSGMSYIGKTTQIFTLRWYQHFFQHGNCKFHEAIKASKFTDWVFEVVELVFIPDYIKTLVEIEKIILERERYYISMYDTIENGYNSKI